MRLLFGNALLVLGIALLALTGGLYGYGEYERLQFERSQADLDRFDQATATAVAIGEVAARAEASGLATATAVAAEAADADAPPVRRDGESKSASAAGPVGPGDEGKGGADPAAAESKGEVDPAATKATAEVGGSGGEVAPTPTAVPVPSPTATPAVTQIRHIVAKSIGLDAPVVEARVRDSEWEVPKFVAGHLDRKS